VTGYVVLDVFTDRPFGGNPLAVFPDAAGLPEEMLQSIAREFNFSETTFVLPPTDADHTARVRIFTPGSELAFAGHPTIGTAVALANRGAGPDMVLELGVGPISTHATAGSARFTTRHPLARTGEVEPASVAACVGLEAAEIGVATHRPVVASVGGAFLLAEVPDPDALARARPQVDRFREAAAQFSAGARPVGVYLYHRGDPHSVRARMFAPLEGIPEDPATGSAAAALGAFLCRLEGRRIDLTVAQGVEMGRPSRIDLVADAGAVTISGKAVEVMRGDLLLP
jgi:trans-2,3-dihydro-3-hydroxyanthranilate isomerase